MAAMLSIAAAILLAAVCPAWATTASVTPVQKVIEMLGEMQAKAKTGKNDEAVQFATFSQFCKDTTANKEKAIAETKDLIEVLAAEATKLESDAAQLASKIEELQRNIDSFEGDLKATKEEREKDHEDYVGDQKGLSDGVDALERAIAVLQKQQYDRKQAEMMLLQLTRADRIPEKTRRAVAAYLQLASTSKQEPVSAMPDDRLSYQAPEANSYEFQSGGIVEMLKKMREEMRTQLSDCEKQELNSKHAANMMSQDLSDSVENAEADVSSKTQDKFEKNALEADTRKQLAGARSDYEEDTKFLSDLKAECKEKTASFEEKQNLRAEEIEALGKAIEILESAAVSGAADKHLPALVQKAGTALAQLRASSADEPGTGVSRAVAFLVGEGARLRSSRIAFLAEQLSKDPFVKVKKMIDDMITRLLEETNQESEHKGFCDKEIGMNKKTRDKLSSDADDLSATVDETSASLIQIADELKSLAKEIADLNTAMQEATSIREAEMSKNMATIEDAQAAQAAVESATAIIKDYYQKAGRATALLQQPLGESDGVVRMGTPEWNSLGNPNAEEEFDHGHQEGMQTFGKTYRGQQDAAGGVLAMLEVILGDFANLEADTKADEAEAASIYKGFMDDSKKSVAVKEKRTQLLTSDQTSEQSRLVTAKKDLASTQDQLLAADRYYDKLKPQCVGSGITYEARAKAREEEIQSLQEALEILTAHVE